MNQTLKKAYAYYRDHDDLLSFVEEIQAKYGYVSSEHMKEIASLWGVSVGEIYGLVTFYSFLSTGATGRNVLKVCNSTSCYLKNCQSIVEIIERELGIKPGETTDDGGVSLQLVNCIGACDQSPAMMVNDKVYVNLTPESIRMILKECK